MSVMSVLMDEALWWEGFVRGVMQFVGMCVLIGSLYVSLFSVFCSVAA